MIRYIEGAVGVACVLYGYLMWVRAEMKVRELRGLCADVYQVCGVLGASYKVLDNLSAAAHGHPLPHESLLPYREGE